jgi:hypothetical protein
MNSHITWTDDVFQDQIFEVFNDVRYHNKRVGEGLPMKAVVARTFLDVSTGRILEIYGVEQYRVPYVEVAGAEACPPIPHPTRAKLRVVHYYDPATWKPTGNWGNQR